MAPRRSPRNRNISEGQGEILNSVKNVNKNCVQRTKKQQNSSKAQERVTRNSKIGEKEQQKQILAPVPQLSLNGVSKNKTKKEIKSTSNEGHTLNHLVKSLKNDTKMDRIVTRSFKKDVEICSQNEITYCSPVVLLSQLKDVREKISKPTVAKSNKKMVKRLHFKRNDICFAKMTGHAPWPAQILEIADHQPSVRVYFFGEHTVGQVFKSRLYDFESFYKSEYNYNEASNQSNKMLLRHKGVLEVLNLLGLEPR